MNKKKKPKRAIEEFPWQEYEKEEFEEKFPHLAKELKETKGVAITRYRESEEEFLKEEEFERIDFSDYTPTVIDFLRRCETDEEALEIINWLEERGEISHELAKELRIKLVKEGVRSFGPKKEWGWYERHGKH